MTLLLPIFNENPWWYGRSNTLTLQSHSVLRTTYAPAPIVLRIATLSSCYYDGDTLPLLLSTSTKFIESTLIKFPVNANLMKTFSSRPVAGKWSLQSRLQFTWLVLRSMRFLRRVSCSHGRNPRWRSIKCGHPQPLGEVVIRRRQPL